jgi:hypothetical protein
MTDDSPDPDDPFSAAPASRGPHGTRDGSGDAPVGNPPAAGEGASWSDRSAFALKMARLWVEEHQTATMLGAFATGVVVGALFRD